MTEQKTFNYKGKKLLLAPHNIELETSSCWNCFFRNINCEIPDIPSCFHDDNDDVTMLFIEAKEELVNKIES